MPTREQVLGAMHASVQVSAGEWADEKRADLILALFPSFTAEDAALLRRIADEHPWRSDDRSDRLRAMADRIDGGVL